MRSPTRIRCRPDPASEACLPDPEATDEDLLAAIGTGDRGAFRQLMLRHAPAMLALAQRVTGSPDDADEVVQESFVRLWTAPGRWRPEGGAAFATWFYRVVLNASLDRRRRRGLAPLEEAEAVADPAPGGLHRAMASQGRSVVAQSLDELPVRQRQALRLFYFGEISAPQAATRLGLSLPSVEALLVRGRKALRRALNRRGIETLEDIL